MENRYFNSSKFNCKDKSKNGIVFFKYKFAKTFYFEIFYFKIVYK